MPDLEPFNETAQRVAERLSRYLGPHTARVAVKSFATRALGKGPDALRPEDLPALTDALRPMLRTFVGKARCELILQAIAREGDR